MPHKIKTPDRLQDIQNYGQIDYVGIARNLKLVPTNYQGEVLSINITLKVLEKVQKAIGEKYGIAHKNINGKKVEKEPHLLAQELKNRGIFPR